MMNWVTSALILIFIYSFSVSAQEYSRTFTKEIQAKEQPTISTNVPSSLGIHIEGFDAVRSNTKYGYIVIGSKNKERLYINKDYVIETWDKDIIRQEVDVTIRSASKEISQSLLDKLEINIEHNRSEDISIDANMNINSFTMTKRRMREEISTVILDDGSSFKVDYLEFKTRLFIPRKSNLKVNSILHHTLHLGILEGDLDLDIQYGEVYGKSISNLNANLRFCYNVIFEKANHVIASATNSHLKVAEVNRVDLGKIRLRKGPLVNEDKVKWLNNNSSMNLYNFKKVGSMNIYDSANDDFNIGEVNELEIKSSIFSNYQIMKLKKQLDCTAKNSDLSIVEIDTKFKKINIHNSHSMLNLNVVSIGNYSIKLFEFDRLESNMKVTGQLMEENGKPHLFYKIGNDNPTGEINIHCDRCKLDMNSKE